MSKVVNGEEARGYELRLRDFRQRLYGCFGRRADALFELTDAVLSAGTVPSPPH